LKYVVVIAVIGLLLFLLYRRARPYLVAGRDLLATIRELKHKLTHPTNPQNRSEKLICCDACGTWVPSARMLVAKSGKMFCSRECLSIQRVK
jgi:predicted SprT family Zn-dependent metalloprotease